MSSSTISLDRRCKVWRSINVGFLNDPNLSLKAKGLMAFLLTRPDGWTFTVAGLSKVLKDGRDAIRNARLELEEFGYLKVTQDRTNGTFGGAHWELSLGDEFLEAPPQSPVRRAPVQGATVDGEPVDGGSVDGEPGGRGIYRYRDKNIEAAEDDAAANKLTIAGKIAKRIYSKTNPKSPVKAQKAEPVVQELLDSGYSPRDVLSALTYAAEHGPTSTGFPGWRTYLAKNAPQWLTKPRKGKSQTPFESIFASWEDEGCRKHAPATTRDGTDYDLDAYVPWHERQAEGRC